MIIFVVTDIDSMSNISEEILRKLSLLHDVMFVNVSDEQAKVYKYLENLNSVNNARQSCPYPESYNGAQNLIRSNSAKSVLGV